MHFGNRLGTGPPGHGPPGQRFCPGRVTAQYVRLGGWPGLRVDNCVFCRIVCSKRMVHFCQVNLDLHSQMRSILSITPVPLIWTLLDSRSRMFGSAKGGSFITCSHRHVLWLQRPCSCQNSPCLRDFNKCSLTGSGRVGSRVRPVPS